MSRATDLIAECKAALVEVENAILEFEHDAESEIGHWTDLAQLEIATNRLGILRDALRDRQVDRAAAGATVADPESEDSDEDLDKLSRKDLNAKAQELGIEGASKLANKDAVIAAIREVQAVESESGAGDADPESEDSDEE